MDFAKEFKLLAKKHGFEIGVGANHQLVVPSLKGDLVSVASFPGTPCRGLDSSVPFGTGLRKD